MRVKELRELRLFKEVLGVISEGQQRLLEEAARSADKEVAWALLNQAKGCALVNETVERFLSSLEELEEKENGD